jgi:hypothetical protein
MAHSHHVIIHLVDLPFAWSFSTMLLIWYIGTQIIPLCTPLCSWTSVKWVSGSRVFNAYLPDDRLIRLLCLDFRPRSISLPPDDGRNPGTLPNQRGLQNVRVNRDHYSLIFWWWNGMTYNIATNPISPNKGAHDKYNKTTSTIFIFSFKDVVAHCYTRRSLSDSLSIQQSIRRASTMYYLFLMAPLITTLVTNIAPVQAQHVKFL